MKAALLYREAWGVGARLYAGYRNRLPQVGDRVLVTNVMTNTDRVGIVVGVDGPSYEYEVVWEQPQVEAGHE